MYVPGLDFDIISGDAALIYNIGSNGEYSFTASDNHDFSISNGTTFLQAGGKFFSTTRDTLLLKGKIFIFHLLST